ncbi:hypothetical protein QBC45DRAFT_455067 [Copromyces sp. CBS 386.78]|nr:hypothetical protein QBC45DRAFT_455067 [Copromyces sp. CBS 386.78]
MTIPFYVLHSYNLPIVVLTDYLATKGIVEQTSLRTTSTDRTNRRLINASIYLSRYNLKVFHIPGKLNFVLNALSRLKVIGDAGNPDGTPIFDDVWEDLAFYFNDVWYAYSEAQIDPELRKAYTAAYASDKKFAKIIEYLKQCKGVSEDGDIVFSKAGYPFFMRDRLIYNQQADGTKNLCIPYKFVKDVLEAAHDDKHHFGRNCMITFNSLMPVTDKTSKRSLLIPGHDTYTATEWGIITIRMFLLCDWGFPIGIISDRDRKFTSAYWRGIFHAFVYETGYNWLLIIPSLQWNLNSAFIEGIKASPHEFLFGYKLLGPLDIATGANVNGSPHSLEDNPAIRDHIRQEAQLAIDFAIADAKLRYDTNHRQVDFKVGDKKVGRLAYKLDLPPRMKIYPVISVVHLIPAPNNEDPFGRTAPPPGPIEDSQSDSDESGDKYELEKVVAHKWVNGKVWYHVKWKGYGHHDNEWKDTKDLRNAKELVEDYWKHRPDERKPGAPHSHVDGQRKVRFVDEKDRKDSRRSLRQVRR